HEGFKFTEFPFVVSYSLSIDQEFSSSALGAFGPGKSEENVAFIINPGYVRAHTNEFSLAGKELGSPTYAKGLKFLGLDKHKIEERVVDHSFPNEIHGEVLPAEAIYGMIVHPDFTKQIIEWDGILGLP